MTDHLPECPVIVYEAIGHPYVVAADLCICWRLRACEARVTDPSGAVGHAIRVSHDLGYAAGLAAAHDAVAALKGDWVFGPRIYKHEALHVIKSLKEKP